MKEQHTLGPWRVDDNGQIVTEERTGPCSHEIIAHMPAWFPLAKAGLHATQDHILANARLIVAAPEMLEALQNLLCHHRIADLRKLKSDTLNPRIEAAEAAIAKATGKGGA